MALKSLMLLIAVAVGLLVLSLAGANLVLTSQLEPLTQTGALGLISALFLTGMAVTVIRLDADGAKARRD
jgi:uncharacterized YccA/Bax inhibitor family protein